MNDIVRLAPLRTSSLSIALLISLCTVAAAQSPESKPRFKISQNEEGISVEEAGRPVLFYQLKERTLDGKWPRSNYIHPLYDLSGHVISEDFPSDHKHHRGIFWAWHQLKRDGKSLADPWICEGIQWLPPKTGEDVRWSSDNQQAHLEVRREWTVKDAGKMARVVAERTSLVVHRSDERRRRIDFTIRLRALVDDISIGGSDDIKGYGGFSTRIVMDPPLTFHGIEGAVPPQTTAVAAGPWLDMVRAQDATGDGQKSSEHVAIFCHPSAPEFPPKWILRSKRSMQNVAWPGRHATPLPTDKDITLRYRVLLHRDPMNSKQLRQEASHFAAKK